MAKPPVAFPGLEPAAWDATARSIARTAARDIERLTAGTLTRGKEARLRSLVESLRQLYALSTDEAWVAARAVGSTSTRLSRSLDRVLASVPDSTWKAVEASSAWVAAKGAPVILSEGAMSAIVARTQAAITADWTRLAVRTQTGIVSTLRQSVVGGLGARDAATAMYQGIYGQTGLTYSRALTIARTELADAYQSANLTTYLNAGATHYEWWADTTSSRTCAMCLALHGTVYPINEVPPEQHHNCRCEMLPVFPDETRRVRADGRMPGTRVPNTVIQERLPSTWKVPREPRDLIGRRDVPGWRGVKVLVKP